MKIFFFPCSIGVRCQTNKRCALAVIDERGAKRVRFGKVKNKIACQKIPFIRGICYFFQGIVALIVAFWESCKISEPIKGGAVDKASKALMSNAKALSFQ